MVKMNSKGKQTSNFIEFVCNWLHFDHNREYKYITSSKFKHTNLFKTSQ